MIIDAFENEIIPMSPTGFEDDKETPRNEDKEKKR